jgi:DNA-binding response OmpR family regulator
MNERILVVDDEESLRLSLKFKLKSAGFDVDVAVDGEDALEKLKARPADAVLLDINMPRMSGIETLTLIRQQYPQTEAIMLTGFADFSTAIECLKIGAKDYLVKPVDTTELVTRLRSLVRSRSTERALQEVHQEYLGFLTGDVLEPLKKIQASLDTLAKLSGDAEKERKKALSAARDAADTIEAKVKVLAQFAKEASEAAEGTGEASAMQLTEHLKGIRQGSGR